MENIAHAIIDLEDNCGLQMKSKPANIGESSGDAADNASQNPRASDNQGSSEENAELVPQAANLALNGGRKHADSLEKDEFEPKHRKLEKESHSDATDDAPRDPGPCDNQDSSKKDTEKKKGINIESSDFKELSGYEYYVDKTLVIEKIFSDPNDRIIITVPRHWGKSTMISSIQYFAQIQVDKEGNVLSPILSKEGNEALITDTENYKLFEKRKVSGSKETMKHLGKYPVIHLDLKDDSSIASLNDVVSIFRRSISKAYSEHEYLVHSPELSKGERYYVKNWCSYATCEEYDKFDVAKALQELSRFLKRHFNKKCLVLIDEYDSVMLKMIWSQRLLHKDIKHMHAFIARIYLALLRANPNVGRQVITGISYMISVWSEWGYVQTIYRFLEAHRFNCFFGLTQSDIEDLFCAPELQAKKAVVEKTYEPYYTQDGQPLYNIFSVMCYLANGKPENYWEKSCPASDLLKLFHDTHMRWKIKKLLSNESVEISIFERVDLRHLLNFSNLLNCRPMRFPQDVMHDLVLQFLLEQGYLTIVPESIDLEQKSALQVRVKFANKTIMDEFKRDFISIYKSIGLSEKK